jgi:hypothetical protein
MAGGTFDWEEEEEEIGKRDGRERGRPARISEKEAGGTPALPYAVSATRRYLSFSFHARALSSRARYLSAMARYRVKRDCRSKKRDCRLRIED